jgi:hypothetical protein
VQQSLLGVGFLETTEVCVENNNIKRWYINDLAPNPPTLLEVEDFLKEVLK